MSQQSVSGPYGRPVQPGQYGCPAQQNHDGQAGLSGPRTQYGQASWVGDGQRIYGQLAQPGQYGQASWVGDGQRIYGQPTQPGQYGQYGQQPDASQGAGYGQAGDGRSGYGAPGGPQPASSAPPLDYQPSRLGPIPVEQDKVVFKSRAAAATLFHLLVGGGFGLVCLAGAVWNLIHLGEEGTIGAFFILLLLGVIMLLGVLLLMSARTVFDASGIHLGVIGRSRDFPWPRSRASLFVQCSSATAVSLAAGRPRIPHADAYLVGTDGRVVLLPGLRWSSLSGEAMERRGNAELDRVWNWAVARGYTQETGVPVRS